MANPFSGLENIGQSYLQGVQLAQRRQEREDALAQRREEAAIRERYYQDLVQQRADAARIAAQGREDALAIKFGENLTYNPDGSINFIESAKKMKVAGDREQLLETAGFAETIGASIPGLTLTEEDRKSPRYNRGRAEGIVQRTKDQQQFDRILASQGIFPSGSSAEIPADLESAITGQGPATIFDIMSGAAPGAPAQRVEPPEGMTAGRVAGRNVIMRKPKAATPAKTDYPGKITIETPEGPMDIKLTAEQIAERLSKARPPAGATNAVPIGRITFDPNAPLGATFTPLK
jgi:hypothetical protein